MSLEYARHGLIGVLTPQANTTAEPEFGILMPAGVTALTARMFSTRASLDERLIDYMEQVEETTARFANAPLRAVGFACTGSSYLVGRDRESEIVPRIEARSGRPFITAGNAVATVLRTLDARRIALVSPYPASLTKASVGYWESHGFEVAMISSNFAPDADAFDPIYSLSGSAAAEAVRSLKEEPVSAIVMLGTGLPSLAPILAANQGDDPLVVSCMLCLAWNLLVALGQIEASSASIVAFARGAGWRDRFLQATIAPVA